MGGAAQKRRMEQYTSKRGFFKKGELAKLATALGFPSDFFLNELSKSEDSCLRSEYAKLENSKFIAEKSLKRMLKSGGFNHRLEKIFNQHDAQYNIQIILKAMQVLHHRQLSYREISQCRLAFELYSVEDGSGLAAELEAVSLALKLTERVMAPSRLEAEIQKQQHYCDLPSRIRLHEFFELVTKCSTSSDAKKEMELEMENRSLTSEASAPDVSKMLTTSEQQLVNYLDKRYRETLVKRVEPVASLSPVTVGKQSAVSAIPRKMLRALSEEHSFALVPPLEKSQQRLHQARNGTVVFPSDKCAVIESVSRSSTSMSVNYRNKERSGDRLQQRRNCKTRHKLPSVEDPIVTSKSAPNLLFGRCEENDDLDLTDAISKICVGSVEKAREVISQSFVSLPQYDHSTATTLPAMGNTTSLPVDSITLLPVIREVSEKTKSRSRSRLPAGHLGVALSAIVTKDDIQRHEDRISELEWERLTKSSGTH